MTNYSAIFKQSNTSVHKLAYEQLVEACAVTVNNQNVYSLYLSSFNGLFIGNSGRQYDIPDLPVFLG